MRLCESISGHHRVVFIKISHKNKLLGRQRCWYRKSVMDSRRCIVKNLILQLNSLIKTVQILASNYVTSTNIKDNWPNFCTVGGGGIATSSFNYNNGHEHLLPVLLLTTLGNSHMWSFKNQSYKLCDCIFPWHWIWFWTYYQLVILGPFLMVMFQQR